MVCRVGPVIASPVGAITNGMSEFCSLCQVVEVGPYCPEHGLVHRSFSIGGRYDVEELIGAGVAWFVFGAHDRTVERSVAVNVLRAQRTGSQATAVSEVRLW